MIKKTKIQLTKKDCKQISNSQASKTNKEKTQEFENEVSSQFSKQDFLADLQNLDIDPIQNKNGDKFVIDEIQQNSFSQSSKQTNRKSKIKQEQVAESRVWPDVFYGKKNIMNLLQQRNDVCQMYNLNSKSLKQSNTLANKRAYNDSQIIQYVKQLFSQSPSYSEYDSMCFTIIPQLSSISQKYFVFMSSDLKFVPQCKACNCVAYLVLNVQKKSKNMQTLVKFSDNSTFIKGKIVCSYKNCRKSLLGQFIMSHNDKNTNTSQFNSDQEKKSFVHSNQTGQRFILGKRLQKQKEEKKQPELSEKQKMMIRKATLKMNS